MITNFKIFEGKVSKPNINSVSPEFWKMIKVANWNKVIVDYHKQPYNIVRHKRIKNECMNRIYSNYTFEQIKDFSVEYDIIYNQLYQYFYDLWLEKDTDYSEGLNVSDDGYSDLLSSIIGKGKEFISKSLKDKKLIVDMANNNDYLENFGYLLNVNKKEYNDILIMFNPLLRDVQKYNL